MMPDDLPKCTCGEKNWNGRGGSFGPGLNQQPFSCNTCYRVACYFQMGDCNGFFIHQKIEDPFPKSFYEWFDTTILATWRDREKKVKVARDIMSARWRQYACQEVGIPIDSTNDVVHALSDEKRKVWHDFWDLLYKHYPFYRNVPGFENPVLPPKLPENIDAHILLNYDGKNSKWQKVSREETFSLTIPEDPIRVEHDAFFKDVFEKLQKVFGIEIKAEHIPNRYMPSNPNLTRLEPWFEFLLGDQLVVVGPRKSVTAIQVVAPNGIDVTEIRNAAKEANVTYIEELFCDNKDIATSFEVHAWNKKELIEFLTIIGNECLSPVHA